MIDLRALCVACVLLFLPVAASAQQVAGITPCAAESLSVSGTSGNIQLSQCGPTVIVYNITSQEAFYQLATSSAGTATTSNYSLPGNQFVVLQIAQTQIMWLAAITGSSTTTFRIVQGLAAP